MLLICYQITLPVIRAQPALKFGMDRLRLLFHAAVNNGEFSIFFLNSVIAYVYFLPTIAALVSEFYVYDTPGKKFEENLWCGYRFVWRAGC